MKNELSDDDLQDAISDYWSDIDNLMQQIVELEGKIKKIQDVIDQRAGRSDLADAVKYTGY
jgi:predicted  nucleic acid-binding Zn-ribbon protein